MDNVIIKKSSIHGQGVFAAKNFQPGEEILEAEKYRERVNALRHNLG